MHYYLLFTSDHCPSCPQMKKAVQSLDLGHFEFNVDKPEGSKLAKEFNIRSLPTFIVSNSMEPNGELHRLTGSWPIEKIKKAI